MLMDNKLVFSDAQAITASAPSTNIIDTGPNSDQLGNIPDPVLVVDIAETFATLTSLTVVVENSASDFSGVTLLQTAAIPAAALLKGRRIVQLPVPPSHLRYLRLTYTVAGSNATAGKINAFITAASCLSSKVA